MSHMISVSTWTDGRTFQDALLAEIHARYPTVKEISVRFDTGTNCAIVQIDDIPVRFWERLCVGEMQ